jgi:cytochrome b561
LILAGTDLFYPPVGYWIAQWVAAPGVEPATLVPYSPELYDSAAYESMRAFRKPFASVHVYSFYALVVVVVVHVAAVVITEVKEGGSIISAMFTGRKIISGSPQDEDCN